MPSFLKNCYVQGRERDGVVFTAHHGRVEAALDGYAIIPIEQYDRFILIAEEWSKLKLREIAAKSLPGAH